MGRRNPSHIFGANVKKLGTDVHKGTVKTYYADGEGGLVIKSETDITPFIEKNKAEYDGQKEHSKKD